MNRLEKLLANNPRNLLAIYFTAGYPSPEGTHLTILDLDAAGADIVEIGMPFSDPLADGPTIQESSKAALENGMSLEKLFTQLEGFRDKTNIPVLLMGYLNPVLQFGVERFCKKCHETGVDGVILPDLPLAFYEKNYRLFFEKYDLCPVFLVTPQTSDKRIRELDAASRGFLYAVSTASTTGGAGGFGKTQTAYFQRLADLKLRNPVMVGFGISDHVAFKTVCQFANGGVVGSAFIRAQEQGMGIHDFVQHIRGESFYTDGNR
ncbi:MAG: tryptophan synthase subunit alpha [Lewinellaceae bacterium]|nr:tryptophan synthase subunit alpha [Saprospiraceae bacterium]MCB9339408.1 tryptophan synthase subunit alpha [Lewinellaceae bacterium]